MALPTLEEAQELFDYACQQTDVFNIRNGQPEGSSRRHYQRVAENAKKIAEHTKHLNPQKAYILGLLHDYGEVFEQRDNHLFHGTAGYDEMIYLGFDEVARTCLSHSFFEANILPENYASYNVDCIRRAAQIIAENPLDDYDRLVQISDLMAKGGQLAKIENRLDYIAQKYKVPADKIAHKKQKALALKTYFDKLCGKDIYKIVGIIND